MGVSPNNSENQNIDLKDFISKYLRKWKWFTLGAITFLALGFLHLRYAIPEYSASAKIQIIEDKGAASELSVLQDLDVFSGGKTKIEDEIEILGSRSNFLQVARNLKLNVKYTLLGNIKNSELYSDDYPFKINFLAPDSTIFNSRFSFFIDLNSDTSFGYYLKDGDPLKVQSYGSAFSTPIGEIVLIPNNDKLHYYRGKRIKVDIIPLSIVAESYRKKAILSTPDKFSNIINISLTDPSQQRAIDVINELIRIDITNAIQAKKAVADRTTAFINDRISEIYSSLSEVDETEETFKSSRGIADLGSQSNVNFSRSAAGEQELQDANVQLSIANSIMNEISQQSGYEIIPTNIGLSDQGISEAVQTYNDLVSQRNGLLKSSNEKNPVIVQLDQQLRSIKRGIESSLNNISQNLSLKVNSLSDQLSRINSRIYAAPSNERALRDIGRKQQTTEALYLYLLQKREESQITFASASPKSEIIDSAFGTNRPVSPQPIKVYLASFIVGLLIPFAIIYSAEILDNKLHNKLELERIIGDRFPVLAELPRLGKKDEKIILKNDRSVMAESMRILRTNLDYVLKNRVGPHQNKNVIFVTSSVPEEGKTLVSSNLSLILANTGKKVLLIGADIRNPRIFTLISNDKRVNNGKPVRNIKLGLSEYLFDHSITLDDITVKTTQASEKIDIIYSGKVPPNPTELLLNERLKNLFEEVSSKYDYVIVDTAPVLVVTDTLQITKYADQILYVTKAGVTEKKVLSYPLKLAEEKKIKNLAFIVNNVSSSNLGYGGKYGYGYGSHKKKWWQFGRS